MSIKSFILKQVREFIRSLSGDARETLHILCAVSGGCDSMVLLDVLAALRGEGIKLSAAHFNHRLRQASRIEEELVRAYASARGITLITGEALPRDPRTNLEAWAREQRYAFLEDARKRCRADFIATAHQLDDQAETLLLRLFAGRLMTDARSIAPLDVERALIRPLLNVRRREIEQYAQEAGLTYALDQSNYQLDRTRNIIRHRLLPQLARELNPSITESLAETADRLNQDENFLEQTAAAQLSRVSSNRSGLKQIPHPLRWRALGLLAEAQLGKEAGKLGYRSLQTALSLLEQEDSVERSLDLGFGIKVSVDRRGEVRFKLHQQPSSPPELEAPQTLAVPGVVTRKYDDGSTAVIEAKLLHSAGNFAKELQFLPGDPYTEASAYFDWQKLIGQGTTESFSVRERREGDQLKVLGRGTRKLKKLLQERGLILTLRDRIPIVLLGSAVIWVPGTARAEIAPVSETTATLLRLTYRRTTS